MIPFRSLRMPLCALAFAGVFAAGAGLPAVALDANDRKEVEAIIKEYLIKNPEVLRDAIMELQKREAEAESKQRAAAVKQNQKLIYKSPRGVVVGNKNGDVTLVEFFDYNCGYCKRALDDMMTLMKGDSKLKFVLKEFPVLGQGSRGSGPGRRRRTHAGQGPAPNISTSTGVYSARAARRTAHAPSRPPRTPASTWGKSKRI